MAFSPLFVLIHSGSLTLTHRFGSLILTLKIPKISLPMFKKVKNLVGYSLSSIRHKTQLLKHILSGYFNEKLTFLVLPSSQSSLVFGIPLAGLLCSSTGEGQI